MTRGLPLAAGLALALAAASVAAQTIPDHTSVGRPQRGRIAGGGVELPARGPGYHFRTHRQRRNPTARYGTPALVGAIQRAAARVAERYEGSDLEVQDLSLPNGGRIRGHGSHTSGRDADIAYYAQRADGARIDPTVTRWFLGNGRARRHSDERFDVERTWLLLRSMLEDDAIEVQYFFMHPAIQRRLLAEAEGPARAALEEVVRTPRGRNMDPHADHFHVRIRCPEADRAHGCVD